MQKNDSPPCVRFASTSEALLIARSITPVVVNSSCVLRLRLRGVRLNIKVLFNCEIVKRKIKARGNVTRSSVLKKLNEN